MKIRYICILSSILISASILFASPVDTNAESENIILKKPIPTESRIILGSGAKIIVVGNAPGKLWSDDIVLISNARIIEDESDQPDLPDHSEAGNENYLAKEELGIPLELSISKAFPNPFNPIVNVSYGLPETGNVRIVIHDLSGRKIVEHSINNQSAGWHEFIWNATDLNGRSIGSGIYLMTIQANDMIKQQKITYLK